jgi:hypothetical protein
VCALCVPRFNAGGKQFGGSSREFVPLSRDRFGSTLRRLSLTDALDRHPINHAIDSIRGQEATQHACPLLWVALHDERHPCLREIMFLRTRSRMSSDSAGEKENQQNQQDQSETTAWIVPPASAIRPRRQRSEQQQNEEDEQDGCHGNTSLA